MSGVHLGALGCITSRTFHERQVLEKVSGSGAPICTLCTLGWRRPKRANSIPEHGHRARPAKNISRAVLEMFSSGVETARYVSAEASQRRSRFWLDSLISDASFGIVNRHCGFAPCDYQHLRIGRHAEQWGFSVVTDLELHAEAKRRVQRSTPSLTDEQWNAWLTDALRNGASIVLQLDGCRSCIPDQRRPHASRSPSNEAIRMITRLRSHLGALEAPDTVSVVHRRDGRHFPTLGTCGFGFGLHVIGCAFTETHVLPLRERSRLLRARRRHSEPSRPAPDSATRNENQGNSETSSVHARRLARAASAVKGWN